MSEVVKEAKSVSDEEGREKVRPRTGKAIRGQNVSRSKQGSGTKAVRFGDRISEENERVRLEVRRPAQQL